MNYELWIGISWIVFIVVWMISALAAKPEVRRQSTGSALLHRFAFLAAVLLLFTHIPLPGGLDLRLIPKTRTVLSIALAMTVVGIGFAFCARFYLGGNWSSNVTIKRDHELVRSGPYTFVRHPIYSGILLALLGTVLEMGEVRSLLGLALAMVGLKMKSAMEEKFMTQQFGPQYAEYKREVKGIIPFVW